MRRVEIHNKANVSRRATGQKLKNIGRKYIDEIGGGERNSIKNQNKDQPDVPERQPDKVNRVTSWKEKVMSALGEIRAELDKINKRIDDSNEQRANEVEELRLEVQRLRRMQDGNSGSTEKAATQRKPRTTASQSEPETSTSAGIGTETVQKDADGDD